MSENLPEKKESGVSQTPNLSELIPTAKKKEEKKPGFWKKLNPLSKEGFLAEAMLEKFMPMLKKMAVKAKPKLINYIQGGDGEGEVPRDSEGQLVNERLIILRLIKKEVPIDTNNPAKGTHEVDDVLVEIRRKRFTKVSPKGFEGQTPEQIREQSTEEVHSADDWLIKLLSGDMDILEEKE